MLAVNFEDFMAFAKFGSRGGPTNWGLIYESNCLTLICTKLKKEMLHKYLN